jgi:hypothetical protein
MPMELYPPARLDATRCTHSRRRTISGGTGHRPLAYRRTEATDRPNNLASSVSPRSSRIAMNTSCSMQASYGVARSSCLALSAAPLSAPQPVPAATLRYERLAANPSHPSSVPRAALRRQIPEVGAECLNRARSVLCGGLPAMGVPTAISGSTKSLTVDALVQCPSAL